MPAKKGKSPRLLKFHWPTDAPVTMSDLYALATIPWAAANTVVELTGDPQARMFSINVFVS